MTKRLRKLALAALAGAIACPVLASSAAASPRGSLPPVVGGASQEGVTQQIARVLARGDGATAGRLLCSSGYDDRMFALGATLSAADTYVVQAGADERRIGRFADAVNVAYRHASVPKDVAVGSFGIGLADIGTGYVSKPRSVVPFWTSQASIGSKILLRVARSWVTPPLITAPCAKSAGV